MPKVPQQEFAVEEERTRKVIYSLAHFPVVNVFLAESTNRMPRSDKTKPTTITAK